MFSTYAWATLIILLFILVFSVTDAINDDNEEFERLKSIAKHVGTSNPNEIKHHFKQLYGRDPRGNGTSEIVKNTLLGTLRGCFVGILSGGPVDMVRYAIVQGVATPTIANITEPLITSNPILHKH
jgi:hypothetical protein